MKVPWAGTDSSGSHLDSRLLSSYHHVVDERRVQNKYEFRIFKVDRRLLNQCVSNTLSATGITIEFLEYFFEPRIQLGLFFNGIEGGTKGCVRQPRQNFAYRLDCRN